MSIEVISVVISLCGVVIAFAVFISNSRKDAGKQEACYSQINAKLDFIGDDLKTMRAEHRSYEARLAETREIAQRAEIQANAAHKRLDRAGVDKVSD